MDYLAQQLPYYAATGGLQPQQAVTSPTPQQQIQQAVGTQNYPTASSQQSILNGISTYNSSTGNLDPHINPNGVWDDNWYAAHQPQLQSVSADDINSIFNPLDQNITNQEQNQQSQLGTTLQQILSSGNTLQGQLDLTNEQQKNLTADQKASLDTEQSSALTQAQRAYQYAIQGNGNQLGYNGSYLFANDLSNQELQYQTGQTQQAYAQAYSKLLTNQSNLFAYTAQKKAEINQYVADQQNAARQTLNDNLTALENTRFAIQSDKAKMTVQAIQQMHDAYNQINLAAYQSQLALDTWKQQYQAQLNSGIQNIQSQAVNYASQNPFNTNYQQNTYSQPQQANSLLASNPYQSSKTNDQFNQLYFPTNNTLG